MNIDKVMQEISELKAMMGHSIQPKCTEILFTDFMEEWLEGKKVELCTNTIDKYTSLYKNHLKTSFQGLLLTEITISRLQAFINQKKAILSSATIRAMRSSMLIPALHEAVGRDLIQKNPASFVKIPQLREKHGRALTNEEINKLMKVAEGHRHSIILPLLLMTGLRRGELLALTWDDIDFERNEIRVERDYVSTTSNRCECKAPKTERSKRCLSVPYILSKLLMEHKVSCGKGKTFVISQEKQDKMVDPTNFARLFRSWCKKAGVEGISLHDTRHTYCSVSLEAGVPAKTIADQVGHTDTRMLERIYAHNRTNELQQKAAAMVGEKFNHVFDIGA